MLIIKDLELLSTDGKNPLLKQRKKTQQVKGISKYLTDILELKEEAKRTNQLLEEIKELLSTNQISFNATSSNNNQQSKQSRRSKEYIPDPNISDVTTSNKKIKDQKVDSGDLQDTLKSLSKIQNTNKE